MAAQNAVWYDLATAVQTGIQALGLQYGSGPTNLPAGQVYARKVLIDRLTTLPLVMCVTYGKPRPDGTDDMEDYRWAYPILVVAVVASNQDFSLNGDVLRWQQQIVDMGWEFERTIKGNVPSAEVTQVEIEYDVSVDPGLWKEANVQAAGALFWFSTTRARSR